MKYLVELNSPNVKADYILAELHMEFGRANNSAEDPDILHLSFAEGLVSVLLDYDRNRLWIKIEAASSEKYEHIAHQIEALLNRSKDRGEITWSQIQI
jgi:hypothetical protein